MAKKLEQHLRQRDRALSLLETQRGRSLDAATEEQTLSKELSESVGGAKVLQIQLQASISDKYDGRPVNLMSGILSTM